MITVCSYIKPSDFPKSLLYQLRSALQPIHFIFRKIHFGDLHDVLNLIDFCHTNDWYCSLCISQAIATCATEILCFAPISPRTAVSFSTCGNIGFYASLALATLRQRVFRIVLSAECALLKYHISPKFNAIFFAIIQDATILRGTIQQAVMVLDCRNMYVFFRQNFFRSLDLC